SPPAPHAADTRRAAVGRAGSSGTDRCPGAASPAPLDDRRASPPPHTPDTPIASRPHAPNTRGPLLLPASGPLVPHTMGIRSPEFVDTVPDLACWELLISIPSFGPL